MQIAEIILESVNNFDRFRYSFEDDWTKKVPSTILVMGPNGSGKTTILRTVGNLWEAFGGFLKGRKYITPSRHSIFSNCRLAAIKIQGLLPEEPEDLWIYVGTEDAISEFTQQHQGTHRIVGIYSEQVDSTFEIGYVPPGDSDRTNIGKQQAWVDVLRKRFLKNRFGNKFDLPNLIFLESENRMLREIESEFSVIPEKNLFNWLSRYQPTTRRRGHIENYLFTLKAIDTEKFCLIVDAVNKFLGDKKITDFDQTTAELMVETNSGESHPIYLLSSGEKQILLMIAFITRELRQGGVLLIDEPGLHLHVSLSNAFVDYIKKIVIEKQGQLIIASHSPNLWERFTQSQRLELGHLGKILS